MPAMEKVLKDSRVFVIAEVGVNHDGDLGVALDLVDVAKECGADAAKFQNFSAERLVSKNLPAANYQNQNIGFSQRQIDVLRKLELTNAQTLSIAERCREIGIEFLSTAFDDVSLDFLVQEVGVEKLKIASGEITNGPLLFRHSSFRLPIMLSTGMAQIHEVDDALSILMRGFTGNQPPGGQPSNVDVELTGNVGGFRDKLTLLQCTTQYPAPVPEANILAMNFMRKRYGLDVGFSDHTKGSVAAIVAVAHGASVIEKHITMDNKKATGPDHKASMNPEEFFEYVRNVRLAESALGSDRKDIQPAEAENIHAARKYLVAVGDIKKGELFTEGNLNAIRAGKGVSPMLYWTLLGRPAHRSFRDGEPIEFE